MYARISRVRTRPGTTDENARVWRDQLLPQYRSAKGFQGLYVLIDETNNLGASITLWDTREDADASFHSLRPGAIAALHDVMAEQPHHDTYEVIAQA